MNKDTTQALIKKAGGPAFLARVISSMPGARSLTTQAISQWEEVPAERAIQVERATHGRVTRHELRPDLYPLDEPEPADSDEVTA